MPIHSRVASAPQSSVNENILGLFQVQQPFGRVLVIHNDRHLSHFLPVYLSRIGLEAVYTDNAHDGYRRFLNNRFDMVMTDLGVIGAWTMACHCKAHCPATPVMLLIDRIEGTFFEQIMRYAIDAWLVKPFDFFALKDQLRKIFNTTHFERLFADA